MDRMVSGPFGAVEYLTGIPAGQVESFVVIARSVSGKVVKATDSGIVAACPCCQRPRDISPALCAECAAAGDAGQEFATPEMPYPYCAATDSSPLAFADRDERELPWLGDADRRGDDDVELCDESDYA